MRKAVIIVVAAIFMVIVLVPSGVVDSLIVFLLSGSVPGTPINLSPTTMMAVLVAVGWLALARMAAPGTVTTRAVRRVLKRHSFKRSRLPKRRYGRI